MVDLNNVVNALTQPAPQNWNSEFVNDVKALIETIRSEPIKSNDPFVIAQHAAAITRTASTPQNVAIIDLVVKAGDELIATQRKRMESLNT